MRVPLEWLAEHCDPGIPVRELEQRLTMSGTKVEAVHRHGVENLEAFVVGKVLEADRHPDADRLTVCRVDVGDGEPAQIVCGAANVAAGQTVAVARPGAIMPDGTKLGTAKLRGVASAGMILAEDELGIGSDHAGIMVLSDELAAGSPLREALPIATDVLELEITPNRPDCLGIYGVAREVHAATGAPLGPAPWADDPGTPGPIDGVEIRIEAPDLNPRFTARAFEDVKLGPSPPWLKARLMAAGLRPINNVVDITNYAMLVTGHPLHAFDLDRVAGGRLVVRRARDGEEIETLDGSKRVLDPDMLVIEDADGPTSIAGVMGGSRSEVHDGTTRVLMEVASWNGFNIKQTSNKLALRSEASGRFEKGLAPEQAMDAQVLATKLMLELTGATLVPGTIDAGPFAQEPWPTPTIRLRTEKVGALLGMDLPVGRQQELLERLGFGVAGAPDGLDVTVPAFRRDDVSREADLVEEVGRFDLDRLPATLPKRRDSAGHMSAQQRLRRRAVDVLVGRGAYEAVGWSFTHPSVADRLRLPADDPRRGFVSLENPMSEEQSVLRTTLAGSLLDVAAHNLARGNPDLVIFEHGPVYSLPLDPLPREGRVLAALMHGRLHPPTWGVSDPPRAGFFAIKALLGAVLDTLRVEWSVEPASEPFLHPGRSGRVLAGGEAAGWIGELHPLVAQAWDLDPGQPTALFEVDFDAIVANAVTVPQYRDLTTFPAVKRDLALSVPEDVSWAQLLTAVRAGGGELLRDAEVFDVYRGAQAGEGRKSVALHLEFRATDRTLTDADAQEAVQGILERVAADVGGEHRG
jgi:phenylalanyl-tRNA synthetase beta chain